MFPHFGYPTGKNALNANGLMNARARIRNCPIVKARPEDEGERIANLLATYTCSEFVADILYLAQCVWEDWHITSVMYRHTKPLPKELFYHVIFVNTLLVKYEALTQNLPLGPWSRLAPRHGGPRWTLPAMNKIAKEAKPLVQIIEMLRQNNQSNLPGQTSAANQSNQSSQPNQTLPRPV